MLRHYASSAEATSIFEASIPLATEESIFEGYRAAAWNEQYVPRPDGHPEFGNLLWLVECWVVRARSFDDTPLNGAPSVESFSKAVLETAQDLLLDRCE